jgi:hypothetical protein
MTAEYARNRCGNSRGNSVIFSLRQGVTRDEFEKHSPRTWRVLFVSSAVTAQRLCRDRRRCQGGASHTPFSIYAQASARTPLFLKCRLCQVVVVPLSSRNRSVLAELSGIESRCSHETMSRRVQMRLRQSPTELCCLLAATMCVEAHEREVGRHAV